MEPLIRTWRAPHRIDVRLTLAVHRRGRADPTFRVDRTGAVWRTSLTPGGPVTVRITSRDVPASLAAPVAPRGHGNPAATSTDVTAAAWGPGAAWVMEHLPELLGAADEPSPAGGVHPLLRPHPLLRRLSIRYAGMRIGRTRRVLEALIPAVLEQKVTAVEAHRAWYRLLMRFGGPAPGPAPDGMRVFPEANVWATIPPWQWHWAGVEAVRAGTIMAAARLAGRLEETLDTDGEAASRRLRSIPGIGPWTVAEVRQRAAGDPDAVSVGDANLPGVVGWVLAGRVVDDAGMLELLAPYAGQRYRVTRLIELSGLRPPRRAPRAAVRDYRWF